MTTEIAHTKVQVVAKATFKRDKYRPELQSGATKAVRKVAESSA